MAEVLAEDYRIVLTGVGGPTPVGFAQEHTGEDGVPTAWDNTLAGFNGVTPIGETDIATRYPGYETLIPIKLGASVKIDVENHPFIAGNVATSRFWNRAGQMAGIAISQALEDGKVDLDAIDRWRISHHIGSVFGGNGHSHHVDLEADKIFPREGAKNLFGQTGLGPVSHFDLRGRGGVHAVECTSSADAAESGFADLLPYQWGRDLQSPKADMTIIGGADGTFVPEPGTLFVKAFRGAPDIVNDDPKYAPRPFDTMTKGFVIGEGAVAMVAEPWHKAQERGLTEDDVLAEVVGFHSLTHAENLTLGGVEGMVRCMVNTLEMADVTTDDIGYIRAHGTGTLGGDLREALAARIALMRRGLNPDNWTFNSTMWGTGHTMGLAALLGLYYIGMSVKYGKTPQPRKIDNPIPHLTDPFSSLKLERSLAEYAKLAAPAFPEARVLGVTDPTVAMSNSFGFSGGGGSIAVRKFKA